MPPAVIVKYDFRIRTRNGVVVDNLSIHGRDLAEAQRKLRQMYGGCEILETGSHLAKVGQRTQVRFEDVMDLITSG